MNAAEQPHRPGGRMINTKENRNMSEAITHLDQVIHHLKCSGVTGPITALQHELDKLRELHDINLSVAVARLRAVSK